MRTASALLVSLLVVAFAASCSFALAGQGYATSDSGSSSEQSSDAYREGQRALEEEDWDSASRIFRKVAAGGGSEVDAALYWKAYADWKAQRKKESVEGLRQLLSSHPESPWADDAKALELEIRGVKGSKGAEEVEDEELKLYALDGLMQVEPDRAVPILEKLLRGDASPRIQERALFVLSQSDSPRAREIVVRIAKTGQPIELRRKAIHTLGIAGAPEDLAALAVIARDTSAPPEIRDAVIDAYIIANRGDDLASLAKSDPDARVRGKAIDALGALGDDGALRQLFSTEKDPQLRYKLLEAFGVAGDVDSLVQAAKDPDPQLRRKAIEGLGITDQPEATRALREMYARFSDPDDKRKVLEAFMIQGEAQTLVELFRAEKDPSLKKAILRQLALMDDPEATRVILDVLGVKP